MNSKEELAPPSPIQGWTRAEDYLGVLARRRTARKQREPSRRTQPEAPRLLLSTLPFLALIAALGLLAVAIMITDFPGNQPQHKPQAQPHEQGVAAKGWFQKAQKEFKQQ